MGSVEDDADEAIAQARAGIGKNLPTPQTVEELAQELIHAAKRAQTLFVRHDEDWTPLAATHGDTGIIYALDPAMFDPEHKDAALSALGMYMVKNRPRLIGFLLNAFRVTIDEDKTRKDYAKHLQDDPRRVETIMVAAYSPETRVAYWADIKRDGTNPPTLSEFTRLPETQGRFDDLAAAVFVSTAAARAMDMSKESVSRSVDRAAKGVGVEFTEREVERDS